MIDRIVLHTHRLLIVLLFVSSSATGDETTINIVRGYEGMARYADAAAYAEPEAFAALFDRHVYRRYERQCGGLDPARTTSHSWLRSPIRDIDALRGVLDKIRTSDADQRALDAAERAATLLPGTSVTICIFAYPPDINSAATVMNEMGGAMGFSDGIGSLWLQLLPTDGWLDEIYPAVTHEYYHAVVYPGDAGAMTLLDVLVNEGGADSLTAVLYPDFEPAWAGALTQPQVTEAWQKMRNVLERTDRATIDRYVFGDGLTVPRQAGYVIGFAIVQAWIKRHPDVPPAEWSRLSPQSILDGSGWDQDDPPED